ncbi:TIGR03620 family F420-dependent LLM class oxidoreductase [Microbacterium sp. No. 7]|uniref:TIGR03620 family F420-dependent LLM class oxidoreductase n=1 Tax=Microbacterium sp. No. 7 TaxID=1714373 RepID=UPI0006D0FCD9|nr:TIGR03620 family F420-dependent LLM class oxidoreductase [Microbacterium sp. No. 7]ALJ18837.1 F420-dependent oxidoreductase [Microbacterium sp. No. 7]
MSWTERLGAVGVWRSLRDTDPGLAPAVEELGYRTLWLGGSPPADLAAVERLLETSERLIVGTSVVNIWLADAAELADAYHRVTQRFPERLILGIGSGHREAVPGRIRPLEAMSRYLDVLDERDVPAGARVLSALGPRMSAIARSRSAGTIPYLTTAAQTSAARATLGPGALVAPEQTVLLDPDAGSGRDAARRFLARYLGMSNYTTSMRRAGFSEHDVAGEGSDALVDAIVAHGDAAAIARAVRDHLGAGADHVCVQVQPASADPLAVLDPLAADRTGLV